jgi:hypothetical protein
MRAEPVVPTEKRSARNSRVNAACTHVLGVTAVAEHLQPDVEQ